MDQETYLAMSMYITFHLKRKTGEMDHFMSFSRSTDIYHCFDEYAIPFYFKDPEPFAQITQEMLDQILNEISTARQKCQEELKVLYRLADKPIVHSVLELADKLREMYAEDIECTEDLVREILWREERVQGLNKTETQIEFMKHILDAMDPNNENRPFEGIYANVG